MKESESEWKRKVSSCFHDLAVSGSKSKFSLTTINKHQLVGSKTEWRQLTKSLSGCIEAKTNLAKRIASESWIKKSDENHNGWRKWCVFCLLCGSSTSWRAWPFLWHGYSSLSSISCPPPSRSSPSWWSSKPEQPSWSLSPNITITCKYWHHPIACHRVHFWL